MATSPSNRNRNCTIRMGDWAPVQLFTQSLQSHTGFAKTHQLLLENTQERNELTRNDFIRKNQIAENFLRLSDLPTCPMDRLSRYEQRLWRQARQIVLTLNTSRRRKDEQTRANYSLSFRHRSRSFMR